MQSKLLADHAQTIWGATCTGRQAAVSCPSLWHRGNSGWSPSPPIVPTSFPLQQDTTIWPQTFFCLLFIDFFINPAICLYCSFNQYSFCSFIQPFFHFFHSVWNEKHEWFMHQAELTALWCTLGCPWGFLLVLELNNPPESLHMSSHWGMHCQ
jgi:hypothetical protein